MFWLHLLSIYYMSLYYTQKILPFNLSMYNISSMKIQYLVNLYNADLGVGCCLVCVK